MDDCSPLSPQVWSDQGNQINGTKVCPISGMVYQRAFNHVKTPITRALAYPDYSKDFESYTDTSRNYLGTVTTRGYCQLKSLRPSRWNLLWTRYSAIEHLWYWCNKQTQVNPLIDKYRPIAFISQNSPSRNTITVSPNWTTSHSQNLRVQKGYWEPTYKWLLTTNRKTSYEMFYA